MRVLVISNLYPPHYIGGYELGCRDVTERLGARGHETLVLTSTYGIEGAHTDENVWRVLTLDLQGGAVRFPRDVPRVLRREARNQRALRRALRSFRPDIIYVWNLLGTSVSLAQLSEESGVPVCYFVSDKWWSRWDAPGADPWYDLWRQFPAPRARARLALDTFTRLCRTGGVSRPAPLAFRRVHFVSDFLLRDARAAGKPVEQGEVIRWGVDPEQFAYRADARVPRRLLYAGQVTPYKGFRTVIKLMKIVVCEHGRADVRLSVVGGTSTPEFVAEMRELVRAYGLEAHVEFRGGVAREKLPVVYREHDVLIFPSLLDEALTITTLEAMASGVAVVSTATGGNPEVFRHEENALVFAKEDAEAAAAHILRLLDDAELYERLRRNGRRTVEEGFTIEGMVAEIERSLRAALGGSVP
jgi:glycogen(starch) synthase